MISSFFFWIGPRLSHLLPYINMNEINPDTGGNHNTSGVVLHFGILVLEIGNKMQNFSKYERKVKFPGKS